MFNLHFLLMYPQDHVQPPLECETWVKRENELSVLLYNFYLINYTWFMYLLGPHNKKIIFSQYACTVCLHTLSANQSKICEFGIKSLLPNSAWNNSLKKKKILQNYNFDLIKNKYICSWSGSRKISYWTFNAANSRNRSQCNK